MILVIDNYDSFVHNLARYVRKLGYQTIVVRNDMITINEIAKLAPSHIILSPGPCTPDEAGVCKAVVKSFCGDIPILGVCLGHQAIAAAYGAKIVRAAEPMHGKRSNIEAFQQKLFVDLPETITVGRYHSLVIEPDSLADVLTVTSVTQEGEIMSIEHKVNPTVGVQFHPESVMTEYGIDLISNFFKYYTVNTNV